MSKLPEDGTARTERCMTRLKPDERKAWEADAKRVNLTLGAFIRVMVERARKYAR